MNWKEFLRKREGQSVCDMDIEGYESQTNVSIVVLSELKEFALGKVKELERVLVELKKDSHETNSFSVFCDCDYRINRLEGQLLVWKEIAQCEQEVD